MNVDFDDIRVERGGRLVLQIPSLRLHGGRTTAILGPNGSGKTTLLRLIAGLERPRSGRVRCGGDPAQPHVGYVFQEQVFLRQSVRANLELGLRLRGLEPAQRGRRIEDAADLLGITHLLDRRADQLSGGEGRRVSLARALCLQAPLVLLDEPLEGLDEPTYARLLDELPQLLAAFEATTLLVTHNRHEALRLAQDLVVLVRGQVLAAGDKREVARNPHLPDVAEALGFAVLVMDGRRIAVPPGALRLGAGAVALPLDVEGVVDVVERRDVVGRIGDVRVHVPLPESCHPPHPGDRVTVHPERWCELA